jgi:hypothetical protein
MNLGALSGASKHSANGCYVGESGPVAFSLRVTLASLRRQGNFIFDTATPIAAITIPTMTSDPGSIATSLFLSRELI